MHLLHHEWLVLAHDLVRVLEGEPIGEHVSLALDLDLAATRSGTLVRLWLRRNLRFVLKVHYRNRVKGLSLLGAVRRI